MTIDPSDRAVWPLTRFVAVLIVLILILAFVILYFFPESSGTRFAWPIKPNLTAVYMGAGYLGGGYLFMRTALGGSWHRVAVGFPAVTAFTSAMLVATLLHAERFDPWHLPAFLWWFLYIVTPFLVPWLWWRQRYCDDRTPEPGDRVVSREVRAAALILGLGIIALSLTGIVRPAVMQAIWPWEVTPLTARILCGWGLLLGVGNVMVSRDSRWSYWRIGVEAIAIWHLLFLAAAVYRRGEFRDGQWLNWYTVGLVAILALVAVFYLRMSGGRASSAKPANMRPATPRHSGRDRPAA